MGKKIKLLGATLVAAVAAAPAAFAEDSVTTNTVTMPSGVDIPALIQSGVAVLGGIVAIALAAWCGWLLVRMCLRWIRTAMRG